MEPKASMLPAARSYWEARRDQEVRRAELEAEVELRRLEEERKLLEAEKTRVQAELARLGESEAGLRVHARLARWWGGLCVLAVVLTALGTWWSVSWYLTLGWEKGLLAVSLSVLSLIGGMAFLMRARQRSEEREFQKLLCAVGLVIVLSAIAAGALLGLGRMAGVAMTEERQVAAQVPEDLDATAPSADPTAGRIAKTKWLLGLASFGAVVLLTIAGEVGSAIAFDEYVKRTTVVRTVRPYYERAEALGDFLAENARRQEEVRRSPELLRISLTIAGLNQEEAAAREAAAAVESAREEARQAAECQRQRDSLWYLVKRILLAFGIGFGLLIGIVGFALGSDGTPGVVVVLLDLSRSTEQEEFAKNLRAVEGVLRRTPAASRVTVLGITEASFGVAPLFAESSPINVGRFGEYLDDWRQGSIRRWRRVAAGLSPSARGSDLFGALARAGKEFDSEPERPKRLVILSDMRHVGRGFNFERVLTDPRIAVANVGRERLIPRLAGAKVWMLGAHAAGIDERQWDGLKTFWAAYFRSAGAEVRVFTPNRRLVQ